MLDGGRIPSGQIDHRVYFEATPGLSGFTVDGARNAASFSSFTTPTVTELGTTGIYAVLVDEQTTVDPGHLTEQLVLLVTAAGMPDQLVKIELVADPQYNLSGVVDNTAFSPTTTEFESNSTLLAGLAAGQLDGAYGKFISGSAAYHPFIVEAHTVAAGRAHFLVRTAAVSTGSITLDQPLFAAPTNGDSFVIEA